MGETRTIIMRPESFLNTLILSLSVSTVLITLISYLIYKVRQFPQGNRKAEATKKEGVYFRRHIPGEVLDPAVVAEEKIQISRFERFNNLPTYFGIVVLVVFCSLIFKDFLGHYYDRWMRGSEVARLEKLRNQGLFKLYDFNPGFPLPSFKETIPENLKVYVADKALLLAKKKIAILTWSNFHPVDKDKQARAHAGWMAFLKRSGLDVFEVNSEEVSGLEADVYIIPQAKTLSTARRAVLDSLIEHKKGVILTGACGHLDEKGALQKVSYCGKKFDLTFSELTRKLSHPSIFSASRVPGWIIPPGFQIDWVPEEQDLVAVTKLKDAASFESDFKGNIVLENGESIVRMMFKTEGESRLAWLALEPHALQDKKPEEIFYGEAGLLETLTWASGDPTVEVSTWKQGKPSAAVVSVDAEDKIEGANTLWKIYQKAGLPVTFFVVSDQMQNDDSLMKITEPNVEIASHSRDHKIFADMDLDLQFNNIQDSRMSLEEKSGKPVRGFHPPEERFNEKTLNAIFQNRLDYLVGDQRIPRLAPLMLEELVYFPRVNVDDVWISRNKQLISNQDILNHIKSEFLRTQHLGGLYYLNTHSQIMGQGHFPEVVTEAANLLKSSQSKVWLATFAELSDWWRQRSQLSVRVTSEGVKIKNHSQKPLKDMVIFLKGKPVTLSPLKSGEELSLQY